jgi:glycerate 2-kinase
VHLDDALATADLVLTGEGRLDAQTPFGKTVAGVAQLAAARGLPVVALVGGVAPDFACASVPGLTAAFALSSRPLTLAEAQADAAPLLAALSEQVCRLIGAAWRQ